MSISSHLAASNPPVDPLDDPHREHLYALPAADSPIWAAVRQPPLNPADRRIRFVHSRNLQGALLTIPDWNDPRVARCADFTEFKPFVVLNFLHYFYFHPNITAIWIEMRDTDDYTLSSDGTDPQTMATRHSNSSRSTRSTHSSRSSVAPDTPDGYIEAYDAESETPVDACLLIRRSELTPLLLNTFRWFQELWFFRNDLNFPPRSLLLHTINGR